jgi:hypothetical protein
MDANVEQKCLPGERAFGKKRKPPDGGLLVPHIDETQLQPSLKKRYSEKGPANKLLRWR